MSEFLVVWAIHVEADTPREAAEIAKRYRTGKGTTANVYDVYSRDGQTPLKSVDFSDLRKKGDELPQPIGLTYAKSKEE
jgi:hypothetical protein